MLESKLFIRFGAAILLAIFFISGYVIYNRKCLYTPITIQIASSNTKEDWIDEVVAQFNSEEHSTDSGACIVVTVTHVTSGGSKNDILDGKLKPVVWSPGDGVWPPQLSGIKDGFLKQPNQPIITQECQPTVYAPIGFAMWREMAEALGWPDEQIGWDTIVELAADPNGWGKYGHPEWGKFRFGHSHPKYSNTGLLSMTTFVYGIVGGDDPLTHGRVFQAEEAMRNLENNTEKYGIQSLGIMNLMHEQGRDYLHAAAIPEANVLQYNIKNDLDLVFIFPSGGTIWANHPYCILDNAEWVSDAQEEAAALFRKYLLAQEQQELAIDNYLRPIKDNILLANVPNSPFTLENGTDPKITPDKVPALPSPDEEVSKAVIDLFFITKRKASIIIVLDTSKSMAGDKIEKARDATVEFLKRLDPNDEVGVLTFNSNLITLYQPNRAGEVVEEEEQSPRIKTLTAEGSTALYQAVCQATKLIGELQAEDQAQGESQLYGIILLSDGEDTVGVPTQNQMFQTCLPANAEGVKIFPIAFGVDQGHQKLLQEIAERTGGRLFTADPDSISDVYLAISAEQ